MVNRIRLLIVVNVDWFFLSHRLPIALAAKEAGADVYIAAADTGQGKVIESYGLKFIHFPFSRSGTNYFSELSKIPRIFNLYRNIRPDLVHHVTIKPVLLGSLMANLFKNVTVINAITGLGFAFSDDEKAKTIKKVVRFLYQMALRNPRSRTIFQNPHDQQLFVDSGLVLKEQTKVIRGSGVNCSNFTTSNNKLNVDDPIILLASRMIWDKGIQEFIDAAKIIQSITKDIRFVLAGMSDDGNPNAVPVSQLEKWTKEGVVEWWGYCGDMNSVIQRATIVTLPTYYPEGVPKILIEAAASGKPIITTDRPGCREIVRDGINGTLIPEKNSKALADAIIDLLEKHELAINYGKAGRDIAVNEFSEEIVVKETLALYRELLGDRWPEMNEAK